MNRILQKISFLIIGFLFIIPWAHADKSSTDAIIAIVNDDVITLKDLREYVAGIAAQLRVENKSPDEIQQVMGEYEQKGLDKLIEDKLVLAAANDKGIDVRDDIVDKRMKEIKDRYPTEDNFIQALSAEGMSVSDLRQKITDQLKVKYEVDMEVRDKIFVNPQDVTDYYNKHTSDFDRKPMVNLQSIFVSFDKYSKQEARTRADEARSRLLAGESFDTVFQKYSDGSSVGEIEQGQMADSIESVVFNLKLEEVSDPVEVDNGIYVFKAIGISPGKQQTLPEVKDQIYEKLLDDHFQTQFKEWVDKLREKAYIELNKKVIAITMGDPMGIGPEVIRKALASRSLLAQGRFIIIGDKKKLGRIHSSVGVVNVPYKSAGEGSLKFLDKAIALIKGGVADALVTAPLSKEAVSCYQKNFKGHTEYLAQAFQVKNFDMMFIAPQVRLTIVTRHIPLKEVPKMITQKAVFNSIALMAQTLKDKFKIKKPKIAVLGLNPHAGENGLLGSEDIKHILPAIRKAKSKGIHAQGPFPADTFFSFHKPYDGIIAMYHDQGLAPLKGMYMKELVNFTAGLPFVRTSPAHGTAYDIAGKNKADPSSMVSALKLVCQLA